MLRYLRGETVPYQGHSPIGALSVVALLLVLIVQVVSGLGADDEIFTTGPLVEYLTAAQVSWATSIHHLTHRVLYVLVLLHIGAIFFYWRKRNQNLVKPMITGRSDSQSAIEPRPAWLAVISIAIAAGVAIGVFCCL